MMDIKKVKEFVGADWQQVQDRITGSLQSDIRLLNMTNASILANSGKQMRPLLTLLFARACNGGEITEATIRYAASAELLHNATLLHDDVADDSAQRRGVPTIMSLMGPSVAVLIGDYLLVKALDIILADAPSDHRVIKIFSKTLSALAEGELLQLQKAQNGDTVEEDYLKIIYNKTASLFEASCVSAAISTGASEEMVKAAKDYAVALGLAFQIKDDILDYAGTDAVGKPLGADILEQKITMPLLGAFANAGSEKESEIRKMVSDIPSHPEYRDEIVRFVKENEGLEYAMSRLNAYVEAAVGSLNMFPESEAKTSLIELAHFTADRIM
jgi:octaprenyl-diphosphate synthase